MFDELRELINNLHYVENIIKDNENELERLESIVTTLTNKLNKATEEYEILLVKTQMKLIEKKELEQQIFEQINNLSK